jgi:hypothetical protein
MATEIVKTLDPAAVQQSIEKANQIAQTTGSRPSGFVFVAAADGTNNNGNAARDNNGNLIGSGDPFGTNVWQIGEQIKQANPSGNNSLSVKSYVSGNIDANVSEALSAVALQVRHLTGGAGNDETYQLAA